MVCVYHILIIIGYKRRAKGKGARGFVVQDDRGPLSENPDCHVETTMK